MITVYLLVACTNNFLRYGGSLVPQPCALHVFASHCHILNVGMEAPWAILLYIGQDAPCLVHHFSFLHMQ